MPIRSQSRATMIAKITIPVKIMSCLEGIYFLFDIFHQRLMGFMLLSQSLILHLRQLSSF
jgi:hypothetical protein